MRPLTGLGFWPNSRIGGHKRAFPGAHRSEAGGGGQDVGVPRVVYSRDHQLALGRCQGCVTPTTAAGLHPRSFLPLPAPPFPPFYSPPPQHWTPRWLVKVPLVFRLLQHLRRRCCCRRQAGDAASGGLRQNVTPRPKPGVMLSLSLPLPLSRQPETMRVRKILCTGTWRAEEAGRTNSSARTGTITRDGGQGGRRPAGPRPGRGMKCMHGTLSIIAFF